MNISVSNVCIFVSASKQTPCVEPTPAQCWLTVNDGSPTLKQPIPMIPVPMNHVRRDVTALCLIL